jgi:uncharacterized delta-60 repeat protein
MKKLLFTISYISFFTVTAIGQLLQNEWISRYNGPGNNEDRANAIAVDSSGNLYVTGESYGLETQFDFTTIKYNSVGDSLWVRRFAPAGIGWDVPRAITIDHQQNIVVTGYSWGSSTVSNHDYTTIKYNPLGEEQWIAIYNGIGNEYDYAYDVAADNDDNIIVTGTSDTYPVSGVSDFDYVTIKYDSSGDMLWIATYDGFIGTDVANDLTIDGSGNIYVTGESQGTLNPWYDFDYATIKYSPDGDTLWVSRYNGPGNKDIASTVMTDNLGNVYVTGKSHADSNYVSGFDYLTIKYDPMGNEQWVARYNGTGNGDDDAKDIVLDDEGNIYVTGGSRGVFPSNSDILTIKYNQDGDTLWVKRYNGPGNGADAANCISIDKFGNVYVSGYSYYDITYKDYIVLKYSSEGDLICVTHFEGAEEYDDGINSMIIDKNDNVYVTGYYFFTSDADYDFTTIKYSQSAVGIDENTITIPASYFLDQNFPNPFNPSTKINWQSPVGSHQTLKVFDVLGNEIATLVDEYKPAGNYELEFQSPAGNRRLASGIYLYRLQAGDYLQTRKMILLK